MFTIVFILIGSHDRQMKVTVIVTMVVTVIGSLDGLL